MTDNDRDFWIAIRAAHIRRAKLLQQERDCIMEEIAAIEIKFGIEANDRPRHIRVNGGDTIAGIVPK
jgi:hypothetical protein